MRDLMRTCVCCLVSERSVIPKGPLIEGVCGKRPNDE